MTVQCQFAILGVLSWITGCGYFLVASIADGNPENVSLAVSPDGTSFVYSDSYGNLEHYQFSTGRSARLVNNGLINSCPVYCRDGQSVVYASKNSAAAGGQLRLHVLGTKEDQALTSPSAASDSTPCFPKEGGLLYFSRGVRWVPVQGFGGGFWTDWDIWSLDLHDGIERQLTHGAYGVITGMAYDWISGDLLFSAKPTFREPGASRVVSTYSYHPVSGNVTMILVCARIAEESNLCAVYPDVSQDGRHLVFISDRTARFNYEAFVEERMTGSVSALGTSSIGRYARSPRFIAGREKILMLCASEFGSMARPLLEIYEVGLDGTFQLLVDSETVRGSPTEER